MAAIKVFIDKELDVAEFRVEGILTYQELRDAIARYYSGTLTKYTVWDFTNADVKNFRNNELMQIGNQVNLAGKAREKCFDVIIVPGLIHYGLARVYAGYSEAIQKKSDALKTMVFRSREHAFNWIRENSRMAKKAAEIQY